MAHCECFSGVSIHDRGFGFVQFEKEEDAKKSVEAENGSLLKGNRIGKTIRQTSKTGTRFS